MARRAMFKGVMTFGKIRVPVKLYSAAENRDVNFHMLHDKDNVRLRQKMVCELENRPVPSEEVIKGLKVGDSEYVLVEPEDLAELEPETNRDFSVHGFVDEESVDPRYFDRPYHLGPDGEEHKFASLVEALADSGKLGLCSWTFRKRFYNGAFRAGVGAIELVTLRSHDEIVPFEDLDLPDAELSDKELKTAKYLINELQDEFEPGKYKNEFRNELRELVETKARGGEIATRKEKPPKPTESENLMKLLEASLKDAKGKKKKEKVH
jgi:DNA end-binding protein Ku